MSEPPATSVTSSAPLRKNVPVVTVESFLKRTARSCS